jgi:hypothetical protein
MWNKVSHKGNSAYNRYGQQVLAPAIREDQPMPGDATKRACITLKSRQLEALKGLSRETGAPVAELTRRAVDAFLTARFAGEDRQPIRLNPDPMRSR